VPTSRCAATLANAKMTQQCCSCSDEDGGSDVSDAMFLTHSGHAAVVVKHCEHIQQADGVCWIATVTQVPTATKLLVEEMETKSDTRFRRFYPCHPRCIGLGGCQARTEAAGRQC
jgi:hypothetical protein